METANEIVQVDLITQTLQKNNITELVIAKLKSNYGNLKINGIDDKVGFKVVEDARKECKASYVASPIPKEYSKIVWQKAQQQLK